MNVLLHCVYYPPEVGGLESHVAGLAEGLVAEGHAVRVVTSRSLPGVPAREVRNGVEVIRTSFPSRSPLGWVLHALGSIPETRQAVRWADVVHAQAFASVLPCAVARLGTRVPLVATFHTSHFLVRAKDPLWAPILRRLVRWPDHALAASGEIAEVGERLAPGTRVEPLTNGVETETFRPVPAALPRRDGVRRIIIPRRLFPKNGVEFAVRAIPHLNARLGTPVEALFVGDGPERDRLRALVIELGIEASVSFLGARPNQEMPGLLASADVAVFPSLMEATSVAALEAMACELPVVASDVGGLPEIVDGTVGALVPPRDPEALADALARVLTDPEREAMGKRARARVVDHWSNRRLVRRHLEIYADLLRRRNPEA
jgi:glycosyltransferase involved in cell wall biosynthesis